jgi:hypothetical protein
MSSGKSPRSAVQVSARSAALAVLLACSLVATACTSEKGLWRRPASATAQDAAQAGPNLPKDPTTIVSGRSAAELALATSRTIYHTAPAVVLVAENDAGSLAEASSTAGQLGVPVLLTPRSGATGEADQLRAEIDRLGARTVVAVGEPAVAWARAGKLTAGGKAVTVNAGREGDGEPVGGKPGTPLTDLLVVALDQPGSRAAVATAKAAGARVLLTSRPDPRADDKLIKALAGRPAKHVLALGSAFGPAQRLRQRIETAATGVTLPGGGQVLFPGRRMIALYGHPGDPRLGVLGEQSVDGAIARARRVAAGYSGLAKERVVPAFEIITTVASSSAGPDGDYSAESPIEHIRPWVDAARKAGVYVVLDLQPGHTDFLTQAKRYTELLKQPHVGLALDPEWRLKPGQRHMVQIGSVSAAEINKTADWLAELTRKNRLPQKVLMLHQFRLDMITNRATVRTNYDELRVVIHADGFGTAGQKFDTWNAMHVNPPRDVWWGWKNFYDEDQPTFTPRQTLAVKPAPIFVSYQ